MRRDNEASIEGQNIAQPLDILYEDKNLFVINKPPGVLVHRSKVSSRSEPALLQKVRDHLGQRVNAVHRLDRATSGVLIFAKDSETASFISQQFQEKTVQKVYQAVVRGWPSDQTIDYPLAHLETGIKQEAQTAMKVRSLLTLDLPCDRYQKSRYAWVELTPLTGRRHQLRRHLKHLHHPIIGDTAYGNGKHNRLFRDNFSCARLLLHHQTISFFANPEDHEKLLVTAPLDDAFESILRLFPNS